MRAIAFARFNGRAASAAMALHHEMASGPIDQIWALGDHGRPRSVPPELRELLPDVEVLWVRSGGQTSRKSEGPDQRKWPQLGTAGLPAYRSSNSNDEVDGMSLVNAVHVSFSDGRREVDERLLKLGTEIPTAIAMTSFYDEPFVGVMANGQVTLESWHSNVPVCFSNGVKSNARVMNLGAIRLGKSTLSRINYAVIDVSPPEITIVRREIPAS